MVGDIGFGRKRSISMRWNMGRKRLMELVEEGRDSLERRKKGETRWGRWWLEKGRRI